MINGIYFLSKLVGVLKEGKSIFKMYDFEF